MRPLRYSINVTLDGCCDHRAIPADEDLHRHAVENLDQADALLFGRVTYEMMEAAFRLPARTGARPDRNERLARDFRLASRVEFETLTAGVLENVEGLCAKVRLLGCVRIRSLVKVGETLKVQAGTFTSKTPLTPIQPRDGRHRSRLRKSS
jgi:hypothetical protein